MKNDNLGDIEESPLNWRAMAGYVYLVICIFDFLIMPVAVHTQVVDTKEFIIELMADEDKHETALAIIGQSHGNDWHPVTLVGGGLFHLSFGAILTGAAVTRGFERREIVKQNGNYNRNGQSKNK